MQRTVMMVANLIITAPTDTEAFHMLDCVTDVQLGTPWLTVDSDPNWPGLSSFQNDYPIEWTADPVQIGSPNRDNIHAYSASLRVRGIPVMHGDASHKWIRQITTINLTTMTITDGTPVTVEV